MTLGSIVVRLSMATADFETDTGRAAKIAEKRAKEIDASFRRAGVAVGASLLAAGAGLGLYLRNTIEAEKVQAQLASRLKDTGGAAGQSLESLGKMADELQRMTTFDDEAIGGVQAMLLTFKDIRGDNFRKATEAVLDMSVAMGTDLNSAALQVGKALNDPVKGLTALSRAGVQFSADQTEVIKALAATGDKAGAQKLILAELGSQMGTAAEAARATLGGSLEALKNAFDNLLEGDTGGGGVTGTKEAIDSLVDTLNDPGIKRGVDTTASGLLYIAEAAIKATAAIGNAASALAEYFGADDKKTLASLRNKRDDVETKLFQTQRYNQNSLPFFRNDQAEKDLQRELDRLNALIEQKRPGLFDNVVGSVSSAMPGVIAPPKLPRSGSAPAASSRASAAKETAAALRDLAAADADLYAKSIAYEGVTTDQLNTWADMTALLGGPLQQAENEHIRRTQEIQNVGAGAKRSAEEIAAALAKEDAAYRNTTDAIKAQADAMANPGLVNAMDGFRGVAEDFLIDLPMEGGKAWKQFGQDLERLFLRLAAQDIVKSLFGAYGTTGTGTTGGGWMGALFAGMFGGSRAGGGGVDGSKLYEVGEGGSPELFQQNGRTYLIPGNDGRVVPATNSSFGAPPAGAGEGFKIVIENKGQPMKSTGAQMETQPDGTRMLKVFVDNVVAESLDRGQGSKVLKGTYGLQRVGVTRG